MPSDWIQKKAEQESAEAQLERERKQIKEREAELIRSLGPKFVENLRKVIDEDIVAWNENFRDKQINGTSPIPNGFTVTRMGYPIGSATITLNAAALRLDVQLTRSTMVNTAEGYDTEHYVRLRANPDFRDIHMEKSSDNSHLELSGFSRMILEGVAEPNSQDSF